MPSGLIFPKKAEKYMEVIQQIIILYLVAGVGFVLTKLKVFNDQTVKAMTTLVAKVGIPAMTIVKLQEVGDPSVLPALVETILIAFGILLIVTGISFAVFYREEPSRRAVFTQMSAYSNCGFMGYPVIEAALGATGLMHAIGFNCAFTIVTWTIGVRLFSGRQKGAWKQLLNPGLIASLISVVLFAGNIRLPYFINSGLNYLQSMTTPLSMLVTGAYMSRITKEIVLDKKMWLGCVMRLAVYPLLTLGIMLLLPITAVQKAMFFITMLMPCASVTVIQALAYSTEDAARRSTGAIALSTILSAATIPLLLQLMPLLGTL